MQIRYITVAAVFMVSIAAAQTNVTSSGGTANTVPLFTGSATVGNSAITQSGSNVGVDWASPSFAFAVNGADLFDTTGGSGNGLAWFMTSGHNGLMPSLRSMSDGSYTPGQIESSYFIINGESGGYLGVGTTLPQAMLHVTTPSSDSLQWVGVFQNPDNTGDSNVGAGIQFKPSTYENSTESQKWSGIAGVDDVGTTAEDHFGLAFYTHQFLANPSEVMRLTSAGNLGLGTTSPGAKLEVDGNIKLTASSGANITFQDGSVQSVAWTGVVPGGDYAESVDVSGDRKHYEPGDVLVIEADESSDVSKSTEPYSRLVAGIYATKPGVVGHRQQVDYKASTTEVPMAMVGIVPTKVSAENGPIHRGDLLVTSSTAGYAMKGTDYSRMVGAVVGKAMGSLNAGKGMIEVLVTLQ